MNIFSAEDFYIEYKSLIFSLKSSIKIVPQHWYNLKYMQNVVQLASESFQGQVKTPDTTQIGKQWWKHYLLWISY